MHNKFKRYIFLLFILSLPCFAQNESLKVSKINSILDSMHLEKAMETGRLSCMSGVRQREDYPDNVLAKNGEYAGYNKNSKEWSYIKGAYDEYINKSCSYIDTKELRAMYIDFYSSRFSERELDVLIEFYKTSAGKKFMQSQDELVEYISKYYTDKSVKAQDKAYKEFLGKIKKIKKSNCHFFCGN